MPINDIAYSYKERLDALQEALKTASKDEYILVFKKYNIAIRFVDNKPFSTIPEKADVVATKDMPEEAFAFIPSVLNGHGEKAVMVSRYDAILKEIAALEKMLKDIEKLIA